MPADVIESPSNLAPAVSAPCAATTLAPPAPRWWAKLVVKVPWLVGATVITAFAGYAAWRIYGPTPDVSTDDAYVEVHYATLAPRVAGQAVAVKVDDEERVKAGQILVELDDHDYRTAFAQAQGQVAVAQANIQNIDAQIAVQQAEVARNTAQVQQAQASLTFAQQQASRYGTLAHDGWGTVQQAQQWVSQQSQNEAGLISAQHALEATVRQLDALKAQHKSAEGALEEATAQRDQAALNLSYTKIRAPVDGMIAERSVQVGNYVNPGTALMAVVPLSQIYIVANYREVELEHVQAGQPVRIHLDAYDIDLNGTVVGVPAATGATFATLQPDDATGNFTKIVQRLPVKIFVAPDQPRATLLRVGMSVETTIHTQLADVVASASSQ